MSSDSGLVKADALLHEARDDVDAFDSLLEKRAQLEYEFNSLADACLLEKVAQVERIEERLEAMIARQRDKIQSLQNHKPGLFKLPKARGVWADQCQQAQSRLLMLADRLEDVQELKHGMGSKNSRLQVLAVQKTRMNHQELAQELDEAQVAVRVHRLHQQQLAKKKQTQSMGLGQSLTIER